MYLTNHEYGEVTPCFGKFDLQIMEKLDFHLLEYLTFLNIEDIDHRLTGLRKIINPIKYTH